MTHPVEAPGSPPASLVLAGVGAESALATLLDGAGPALARALACPLAAPLDPLQPDRALAALVSAPAALVPLPRDPGAPLADGRHWAAALGAWRQPLLLLLAPHQLETGIPAAFTALLHQHQVPLVGLVQWGGAWQPEQRRLEGLAWLGWLPDQPQHGGEVEAAAALAAAVRCRWQQLRAASR